MPNLKSFSLSLSHFANTILPNFSRERASERSKLPTPSCSEMKNSPKKQKKTILLRKVPTSSNCTCFQGFLSLSFSFSLFQFLRFRKLDDLFPTIDKISWIYSRKNKISQIFSPKKLQNLLENKTLSFFGPLVFHFPPHPPSSFLFPFFFVLFVLYPPFFSLFLFCFPLLFFLFFFPFSPLFFLLLYFIIWLKG
jgi:hypothetical protein